MSSEPNIGATARRIREQLRWSQRETAAALGVSPIHLNNIEAGTVGVSVALLGRFQKMWGIDLYVLAWCDAENVAKFPRDVRNAASKLHTALQSRIDSAAKRCLT